MLCIEMKLTYQCCIFRIFCNAEAKYNSGNNVHSVSFLMLYSSVHALAKYTMSEMLRKTPFSG